MAENEEEKDTTKKYPAVALYGPCTVKNLREGDTKLWCACGLSKSQPWCDGSHKGTGIKPLKWTVPKAQSLYQICACKYTRDPPYCDATHTNLP
ncbi:CDGSH iron-sulfur domain-containing protein 3, mitochondrial-like [Liolophura sinensis]|uniref:CDGSH iron-sulfur domain-containing protein 3, mitochondrial-like n=1 Tax=Liolophura sinensis TaxID=3198878 RepID=UPI0031583D9A